MPQVSYCGETAGSDGDDDVGGVPASALKAHTATSEVFSERLGAGPLWPPNNKAPRIKAVLSNSQPQNHRLVLKILLLLML